MYLVNFKIENNKNTCNFFIAVFVKLCFPRSLKNNLYQADLYNTGFLKYLTIRGSALTDIIAITMPRTKPVITSEGKWT